jgi:thiol-disulfide isomerase/thioredoxin
MYAAGQRIGDFAATTVDGSGISRATLIGTTMVGFFTPGCTPCKERLPLFIEQAQNHHRDQVLAIVAGTPEASADYVAKLGAVARVVREDDPGPVATAFGVEGFPAFALIDADGVVIASGTKLGALATPVPA